MLTLSDGRIDKTGAFHTIDTEGPGNVVYISNPSFVEMWILKPGGNIDIDEDIMLKPGETIGMIATPIAYFPRLTSLKVRRKRLKKKVRSNTRFVWKVAFHLPGPMA